MINTQTDRKRNRETGRQTQIYREKDGHIDRETARREESGATRLISSLSRPICGYSANRDGWIRRFPDAKILNV
jgi:hypothetical protein